MFTTALSADLAKSVKAGGPALAEAIAGKAANARTNKNITNRLAAIEVPP
jgi:hypothetical protein